MAGYSEKSLADKLGFKAGAAVALIDAPDDYIEIVSPLPDGIKFSKRLSAQVSFAHAFATKRVDLSNTLASCRAKLNPEATVWVSWPKKSSKVPTDITEDVVRAIALPLGFVDVKVCAVTDIWSGLKLVVRKALRPVR